MKHQPSYIAPERLYSLRGFFVESGISETRRREAAREGVDLPTLEVGKRKFVQGSDGIAYIEKLAAMESDCKKEQCVI